MGRSCRQGETAPIVGTVHRASGRHDNRGAVASEPMFEEGATGHIFGVQTFAIRKP